MPQAVDCELLLYADDTCLTFRHKDITEIETVLNKNYSMLCDWFVDNKWSIHFGQDKTKSIFFGSKHKIKNSKPLTIQYNDTQIKQYSKVTYLGCIFDETLSGKSMAIHVINKINSMLRFLYRQINSLIFLYVDYYGMQWFNLSLTVRVMLDTQI